MSSPRSKSQSLASRDLEITRKRRARLIEIRERLKEISQAEIIDFLKLKESRGLWKEAVDIVSELLKPLSSHERNGAILDVEKPVEKLNGAKKVERVMEIMFSHWQEMPIESKEEIIELVGLIEGVLEVHKKFFELPLYPEDLGLI